MSNDNFAQIDRLHQTEGAGAAIDRLIAVLNDCGDFHKLFDALLLKKKFELGLPLVQPASFDDVSAERQQEFEESYVSAARTVGSLFLAQGDIPQAWLYFRSIREPQSVRDALDAMDSDREPSDETQALIQVALYEGAHPVKGLRWLLQTHGTCNTITALDQCAQQLSIEDRQAAAALLVEEIYDDLTDSVRRDVERRSTAASEDHGLKELISERDWLFDDGNYHIDVSHLNSVVRFARFLDPASPALPKAIELAEYGSRLAPQYQYPGDPPFDEFYPAHAHFFNALIGLDRETHLGFFRAKLDAGDPDDRPLLAYVLVDLLVRCGRLDEALTVAAAHLKHLDPSSGFSFALLCQQAGRFDALRHAARGKGDLVGYTAALIQEAAEAVSA
jgi:hypothetical protein